MSAPSNDNSNATPDKSDSNKMNPSTLSYAMAAIVLGSSAGMTFYSRRSGQMLSRMKQVTENQRLRNPPKFGPPTRAEWEKLRPRHSFDD
mmetsp:Transcript_36658/g.76316  ORF Transcript_36658/g.76316 Transcript_36658/m.76316 type:complete len:90 (-) Transcript_36658:937-1206(-)